MRAFALIGTLAMAACGGSRPAPVTPDPAPPPPAALAAAPVDSTLMLRTASGLQFRDLSVGSGYLVAAGNTVEVHYVGQLLNGRVFDTNPETAEPLRFTVGARRVIKGWDEGVVGMRVGGVRQLVIPPSLGYGDRAVGPIPAGSTLVFTIKVVRAY